MPRPAQLLLLATALLAICRPARAFYLPGVAPVYYVVNDSVTLEVNALRSDDSALPYDYYDERLHFCRPATEEPESQGESLGAILLGDRIYNSAFELHMRVNESCKLLCDTTIPRGDQAFMKRLIADEYRINWEVDGLPVGTEEVDTVSGEEYHQMGFPLGDSEGKLHNHYELQIQYHPHDDKVYGGVVGIVVVPSSIKSQRIGASTLSCEAAEKYTLGEDEKITYTYSVVWTESPIPWSTRWDLFLKVFDPKIHWFNLINSMVISFFLTGMVGMILLRALHKDISRYNQLEAREDAPEDFGWKLVHGDVFRTPTRYMLLSVFLGSGCQILLMSFVVLLLAAFGCLAPSSRGSLMTYTLLIYVGSSYFSGYMSARFYKMFGGENWKKNVLMTAFTVPGSIFFVFIILNFVLISAKSSAAVPFGTMMALIVLWFLVSVPLCFLGAYFGFKKMRIENPVRTNQIPRQIPEQPFYLRTIPAVLMGGVLPFGAIFIELYFIMKSIWGHQIYYVFGFLFFIALVLFVTCAEVTILMTYFQLCSEDYQWWWRSFLTSGACSIYLFLYSIVYYASVNVDGFASGVLYFGWSMVMSFVFFLLTGFVGFYACFLFVHKIYGSIKID